MVTVDRKVLTREILLAFWKVHILHHAAEEPVVGQWMLAELRRHGYDISPGTLYPVLRRMEANGWLSSEQEPGNVHARRYYRLTREGQAALDVVREMLGELQGEVTPKKRPRQARPAVAKGTSRRRS